MQAADSVSFPGLLRPDELLDRAGVAVPDGDAYETVAGYVMAELGRLPVVGDEIEAQGGSIRVERLDGRRIDRLRFTPTAPEMTLDGDAKDANDANAERQGEADRG